MRRTSPGSVTGAVATSTLLVAGLLAAAPHAVGAGSPALEQQSSQARACRPQVRLLPTLGYGGEALAFNRSIVVGDVNTPDGGNLAAIWRHGRLHLIRDPRFQLSGAFDVNGSGEIVGVANRQAMAFVRLPSGRIRLLHDTPASPGGEFSIYARGINVRGQVAGAADGETLAARWDPANRRPVLLRPATGDDGSFAKAINDDGVVAGDTDHDVPGLGLIPRAAVWGPRGRLTVYHGVYDAHAGARQVAGSELFEINNRGIAAGDSGITARDGSSQVTQATLWSPHGRPHALGFLPGETGSVSLGLTPHGQVSGDSFGDDGDHAFVWSARTGMRALPVPGATDFHSGNSIAHQFSRGTVVGWSARTATGTLRPTMWTCALQQAFVPSR